MTEEEKLENFLKEVQQQREQARMLREAYGKKITQGALKIPLEGFISSETKLVLSDDLEIEKVTPEYRDTFFQRAVNLELRDYKNENNWFFLTYKFEDERRRIGGMETSNRILLIAILFSISTKRLIKINKSQELVDIRGKLESVGISRMPNGPWSHEFEANFEKEDIEHLKKFWPLLKEAYNKPHFALVARRYYFSLIRNQWEDQLIDLVISLEALLIPEMDEVNKVGKIVKRLSRLLSEKFPRGEVGQTVKKIYNLRNKIVHGKLVSISYPEKTLLADQLVDYVKAALQEYLMHYRSLSVQELASKLEAMKR